MRLLFFGDLAVTGFGSVTTDLGRALLDKGVDVRFLSQNQLDELPEPFASRTFDQTMYQVSQPSSSELFGHIDPVRQDYIGAILDGAAATLTLANGDLWGDWIPDAMLLLGDFYGVRLGVQAAGPATFARVPTFHYVPIEGHDLPPLWADMWRTLTPIAMSKFGQAEIEKVTGTKPDLMYHGVDISVFKPVTPSEPIIHDDPKLGRIVLSSKERCKAFFGIQPWMRVIGRCDTNMPRKAYPQMIRALEPVLAERPDAVLALKTSNWDQGGFIPDTLSKLNPDVAKRVVVLDGSIPRHALAALYNAFDVYASNSSEGFGLTIAEAIACGTPAVGLDYSSVPEVIGPCGTVVPVGFTWDNGYAHYWALPEPEPFAKAVAYLLDHPARARELGAQGPRHIAKHFSWADAADVMIAAMSKAIPTSSATVHTAPAMVAA